MDAVDLDVWINAQNPPVLNEIRQLDSPRTNFDAVDDPQEGVIANDGIRLRAVREAAYAVGAQTALAWRYEKLLKITRSQEGTLDRIASFSPFIADKHMLLPSIVEVRERFELSPDRSQLRTVQIQYQVTDDPRAITQAPTWRDYLWREFAYPEDPHPALFPRNEREREVWGKAIDDGWKGGLTQAQLIWENNLNTLVRDIRGRITYRILETRNIVQRPMMIGSQPELTYGVNGKIVNAGDIVYSISVPLQFQELGAWEALWVSGDAGDDDPQFNYQVSVPTSIEPVFGDI